MTTVPDDQEIFGRMTAVMREIFEDPRLAVGPETTARDVELWDSLRNVELMVALQAEFGIRFTTAEMTGLRNAGELARAIGARLRRSHE